MQCFDCMRRGAVGPGVDDEASLQVQLAPPKPTNGTLISRPAVLGRTAPRMHTELRRTNRFPESDGRGTAPSELRGIRELLRRGGFGTAIDINDGILLRQHSARPVQRPSNFQRMQLEEKV